MTNEPPATPRPSAPDGYVLVRSLGTGRSGAALLCRDSRDGRDREVVVRILANLGPRESDRLESEMRALAAASTHPCLVRINRVFYDPHFGLCLEQDYFPNGALQGISPDPDDVTVGALRLGAALAHLHVHGVLHRDVRPADVLLDSDGRWCLANAGIVHAVGAQIEPGFAPRELRGWESPGPAADVYGLGATVHAALTGQPPLIAGASSSPLPPALLTATPPVLAALLLRMLADDPAERPGLTEIDHALRPLVPTDRRNEIPPPVAARPLPSPPKPRVTALSEPLPPATAQRRGLLIAATAAILFFAGAGAVIATDGGMRDTPDELAAASGASPTPTMAPAATPTAAAKEAPKAGPKAAAPKRIGAKVRGTGGTATGPDVVAGRKPRQIIAFVYRGRLAVLFDMERVSAQIKRFEIFSARPDGSGRMLGDDQPGDLAARAVPLRQAYFFGPDVSLNRCVQIRVTLTSGELVPDNRTVCPVELTGSDARDADAGWADYLRYLAEKNAAPTSTKKANATARET